MATTVFGWTQPTVGGSTGTWGTTLNNTLEAIDGDLNTTKTTADAALPTTGGTMTGEITATTQTWTHSANGATGAAFVMDLDSAMCFSATVDQATSITFSNEPASGTGVFVVLELTNGGAFGITWDANLKWAGGTEPSWTTSGVDIVTFFTRDAGANWYGALAIADAS